MGNIIKYNEVAAQIMEHLCTCPEHGYSQPGRYGTSGYCSVKTDAGTKKVKKGDRDCSSACCEAWEIALEGTPYEGKITRYHTTYDMRSVFVNSGLFSWKPMSYIAQTGDVYLDEDAHTAMCMSAVPDLLGEFSISETGDIDGEPGDQTGRESSIHDYYEAWDGILAYNHKADVGATAESTTTKTESTNTKKTLDGIDIASWQEGIDVKKVNADFIIVKVSGGTSYVNPYWKEWAKAVLESGKLLGLYHYACEYDSEPGGKAEAEYFLRQIKGYEGKAVLCLDWEAHACNVSVSYAKTWLDLVANKTGSTPLFYSYASYVENHDLSSITKYPLWLASYPYRYENGSGYVKDPAFVSGTGQWKKATVYQYSSTRTVKGYSSRLDVNKFYGSADDWEKLCGGKATTGQTTQTGTKKADEKKTSTTKKATDKGGTYKILVNGLNVRSKPSLSGSVVASYDKGETVVLDSSFKTADGWVWGTYISYSGKRRYIAVRSADGKTVYAKHV